MSEPRDPSRHWAEIEGLFVEAMDLAPEARDTFIAGIDREDLRREVASLIAHQSSDATFIQSAIGRIAGQWASTSDQAAADREATIAGRRFGAYEVTGILGQGGMGAVYRARRADGQFEQDVAIKLVRHGFETATALERFRQERQILARLAHPAIARLLDGGTAIAETGGETPYLVMEYVPGESITAFCANHALSIPERVQLFRLVCEAVQYAHQQLIVHRDLKPTNILVTQSGQPKLLDFGIAKLLTEDAEAIGARTSTGMQQLTPDYASPEQVTGQPVTAAADIYSLGVLLYELLTGQKAHRFRTLSPIEIGRVVCDTEPVKPSLAVAEEAPSAARVRRQLEGDLDTIILKALQKEPARRYQSVEQLSEDLRRHLVGLPVLARPDTLTYRAAKFVRRNRWPLVASAVVTASLVAGTIVSVWQARRAERRFEQVRTLANSLIYDVHDEIRDLPGSTKARQKIVATALDYLNGLASDAAGDSRLRLDLAAAYVRIADVQGGVMASNLGDVKGALESYRKARDLFDRSAGSDRASQVADVDVKIGDALSYHGDMTGALAAYARAQAIIEPVASAEGASVKDREELAIVFQSIARVQGLARDNTKSLDNSLKVLTIRRDLLDLDPTSRTAIDDLAGVESEVSMALQRMGNPREALPHARQSLTLREQLAEQQPNNVTTQRNLILSYSHVADVLGNPTMPSLGDAAGAIDLYRKMTAVAERLVAADRSDHRAKWDLSNCLVRLGSALIASPAQNEGIDRLEQAVTVLSEITAAEPTNLRYRDALAFGYRRLGDTLLESGRTTEAINHYRDAIREGEASVAQDPADSPAFINLAASLSGRGLAQAKAGSRDGALADGRRGIDVAEHAQRTQSGNSRTVVARARAYGDMGRVYYALGAAGDRALGCGWLDKSLRAYRQVQETSPLDAPTAAAMDAVVRELSACR